MHNIIFSKESKKHLNDIYQYIAQDDEFFANKVVDNIIWIISSMVSHFPSIWQRISIIKWKEFRQIVESTFRYKILYEVQTERIIIHAIGKYNNN